MDNIAFGRTPEGVAVGSWQLALRQAQDLTTVGNDYGNGGVGVRESFLLETLSR